MKTCKDCKHCYHHTCKWVWLNPKGKPRMVIYACKLKSLNKEMTICNDFKERNING